MNKWVLAAAFLASASVLTSHPSAAVEITVNDVGSILNESLSLPANDTPGLGIAFQDYFEFTLPVRELVTLSMTDSATGIEQIIGGVISLNHWTSTGVISPFIPMGALIESSLLTNQVGGQSASVSPDALNAGTYFAEISGVSGGSPIHIAVDSTVTASAVPEAPTWLMAIAGFGLLAWAGLRGRRGNSAHASERGSFA